MPMIIKIDQIELGHLIRNIGFANGVLMGISDDSPEVVRKAAIESLSNVLDILTNKKFVSEI